MGTGSLLGVKRPGCGADHPPPSSAEVMKLYSYTSNIPPPGFQVCYGVPYYGRLSISLSETLIFNSSMPIVILLVWGNVVNIAFKYLHFLQSICQPTNSLHNIQFILGIKLLHVLVRVMNCILLRALVDWYTDCSNMHDQHPALKVNSICRGNYWGSSMWIPTQ
jgi:hypothetical protein